MIARRLHYIAGLPGGRQLDAIAQHLEQESRGVQYAGLFGADGRKIIGNLEGFPSELKMNESVRSVSILQTNGAQSRISPKVFQAATRW